VNNRIEHADLLAVCLAYRQHVGVALGISAIANVLTLAGSIFMLLVYDVVLPGRSVPTLLALFGMLFTVYAFQAGLDFLRLRILGGVAASLDLDLAAGVHRTIGERARAGVASTERVQALRDLEQVRGFLSSTGPGALMDLPWALFFIAILGLLHIWLGVVTAIGAVILVAMTILTDRLSAAPAANANAAAVVRRGIVDLSARHAEDIRALGMQPRIETIWLDVNVRWLEAQQRLALVSAGMSGSARVFRMLLQSAVLTVGALLVINGSATGGVIFASSLLSGRALAPVDLCLSNWKNFIAVRQAYTRLAGVLASKHGAPFALALPAPSNTLIVEDLTLVPPAASRPVVAEVAFQIDAGDALSVIGASASGKSSLARGLIGLWQPAQGRVRIDGAALDQWSPEALARHTGYLPQNVELIDGTIAQNIARFDPRAEDATIIAAALAARVHDMIVGLEHGYATPTGPSGASLSAGQRQRIALARALYGDPFLVVLDEPNSNLDTEGEAALAAAVTGVRQRGGIVVVVSHRPGVLDVVNKVLLLRAGRLAAFGARDEVLGRLLGSPSGNTPRPRVVEPVELRA